MNHAPEIISSLDGPYPGSGSSPKRWGRMDAISRLAVIFVGRSLEKADLLDRETGRIPAGKSVGLVAGTWHGCLPTDLDFAASLQNGLDMASPLLFSYTLPNIALAEAAGQFGLTGPVYAVFRRDMMAAAQHEARRWLTGPGGPDAMVAGALDIKSGPAKDDTYTAEFVIMR